MTTTTGGSRCTFLIESHEPARCSLCGAVAIVRDDLDVCTACGSRRVRSQTRAAAADPYTCPVCYAGMDQPPVDHAICGGCGTHFAYDDCGRTHAELRALWIAHGRQWHYLKAAARDDRIRNRHAELLHIMQEHGDVSDAWCVAEMAALDKVLDER